MIWYRVGSRNEELGQTGKSHFLEHMLFKGTDRYKKGEIDLSPGSTTGPTSSRSLNPALERVVGGWSVTGSVVLQSGRPFTVYSGSNTFSSTNQSPADCSGCTPDMIKRLLDSTAGTEFYFGPLERGASFNTANNTRGIFSVPDPGELGNLPRNYFTGPRLFNVNMAVGKRTRISETHNIEYRLEMQNVTNTPSFGLPDSAIITSSLFMRARGNTVSSARRIQMALKYYF